MIAASVILVPRALPVVFFQQPFHDLFIGKLLWLSGVWRGFGGQRKMKSRLFSFFVLDWWGGKKKYYCPGAQSTSRQDTCCCFFFLACLTVVVVVETVRVEKLVVLKIHIFSLSPFFFSFPTLLAFQLIPLLMGGGVLLFVCFYFLFLWVFFLSLNYRSVRTRCHVNISLFHYFSFLRWSHVLLFWLPSYNIYIYIYYLIRLLRLF